MIFFGLVSFAIVVQSSLSEYKTALQLSLKLKQELVMGWGMEAEISSLFLVGTEISSQLPKPGDCWGNIPQKLRSPENDAFEPFTEENGNGIGTGTFIPT